MRLLIKVLFYRRKTSDVIAILCDHKIILNLAYGKVKSKGQL